jgi:hypothetical protein
VSDDGRRSGANLVESPRIIEALFSTKSFIFNPSDIFKSDDDNGSASFAGMTTIESVVMAIHDA